MKNFHLGVGMALNLALATVASAATPPELIGDYTGTLKGKKLFYSAGVQVPYSTNVTARIFSNDFIEIVKLDDDAKISDTTQIGPAFAGIGDSEQFGTYTVPLQFQKSGKAKGTFHWIGNDPASGFIIDGKITLKKVEQ